MAITLTSLLYMTPARALDEACARATPLFLFDRAEPRGSVGRGPNYSGATQELMDIADVEPTVVPMIDG
jgi:hypothetical protein